MKPTNGLLKPGRLIAMALLGITLLLGAGVPTASADYYRHHHRHWHHHHRGYWRYHDGNRVWIWLD